MKKYVDYFPKTAIQIFKCGYELIISWDLNPQLYGAAQSTKPA